MPPVVGVRIFSGTAKWVVPGYIQTPITGGGGGLLGLEFRMHEGVSSPGILKGRRAKNSDLLTSEVCKTGLVCMLAEQTEPQRYDCEVGMRSLFRTAIKCCFRQLFQWSFR